MLLDIGATMRGENQENTAINQQLLAQIRAAIETAADESGGDAMHTLAADLEQIERQLPDLLRISRRTSADNIEPYLNQIMEEICSKCPAQQCSGFCPVRNEGGCILFRNPRLVINVIDRFFSAQPKEAQALASSRVDLRKESKMFRRILVAVDDSAPAKAAVEMAIELASKFNSKLGLINVAPAPPPFLTEMATADPPMPSVRFDDARALLHKIHQIIPEKIYAEELVEEGLAAEKIVAAAHKWNADLILIGTHGRHGVSRFIIGSTAEAVVRRAPCPVLIARQKATNATVEDTKQEERKVAAL